MAKLFNWLIRWKVNRDFDRLINGVGVLLSDCDSQNINDQIKHVLDKLDQNKSS